MLIGGLTLGLGIFAVFGAILYRIVTLDTSEVPVALPAGAAVPTLARGDLGLPADARLVSTAADDGRLYLTYAYGAGRRWWCSTPAR